MMRNSLPLKVHVYENTVAKPDQTSCVPIAIDLRVFGSPVIVDMLVNEISLVAIEPIGDEDWNVVLPSVPGSSG